MISVVWLWLALAEPLGAIVCRLGQCGVPGMVLAWVVLVIVTDFGKRYAFSSATRNIGRALGRSSNRCHHEGG